MDFLFSFRLDGKPFIVKPSKADEGDDSNLYQNAYTNFLFLTVNNTFWRFIQFYGVVIRFMLATYILGFDDRNTVVIHVNMSLDLLYLIDFVSAVSYRCKWPKGKKPERLHTEIARLVWRNKLYEPRKIWMLVLDALSLTPLQLFTIWNNSSAFHYINCLLPSLRLYRFITFHVEGMKNIFLGGTVMQLILKFAVSWVVLSHGFTVIYYWYVNKVNSLYLKRAVDAIHFDTKKNFEWYIVTFYTTQFGLGNIGFGDIISGTEGERIIMTIIVIVGFSTLNGYLISALSSALAENVRRMVTLRMRMSLMESDLTNRRVPEDLIKKLDKFYRQLWISRKGIVSDLEVSVSLPDSLKHRINSDIYFHALNASVLFKSCDKFSKRAIAQVMKSNLYMAGDIILKRNEINSKMFYVRKGTIEVMSYQDDETQIVTFGAGSLLGQLALLLSIPAKSEVHAATFCEIHTINRKDLFIVLRDYPAAKEIVLNVYKNLLLNALADKFKLVSAEESESVLPPRLFYIVPREASKISRNDICIVNTCPFVYEPNTLYCDAWCVLFAIIIVLIGFYYPYCATFERSYPKSKEPYIVIIDLLLILNIYFNFSTAFVKENVLFSSTLDIARRSLQHISTYVDIIAVFPICYFIKDDKRDKPFILCLRCLESYKIHAFFKRTDASLSLTMARFLRLIKYVLYFFLIDYAVGVMYYLEACYNYPCVSDSWYPNNWASETCDSPIWVSLYIANLMISGTGYGDIVPKNIEDVVFVLSFVTIGSFLFIFLVSEFSAYLSLFGGPKENFMDFAVRVNTFLIQHNILRSVRLRVREFLNMQWEINQGYEIINDRSIFFDTPPHLLNEINQYTKSRGIHNMKLLSHVSKEVLHAILSKVVKKMLPPHEVLIYGGDFCNYVFIIEEGFCEVTYGKDATHKKIVGPGQDLCTVEVVLGLCSLCNIRTLTHCTVIKIDKSHLMASFQSNAIAGDEFSRFITEFKNNPMVKAVQKSRPPRLHLMVRPSIRKSVFRFQKSRKEGKNVEYNAPFNKLGLCQFIRFILVPGTVLPYGKLLKIWESFRCLFAFWTAMLFPLLPFFQLEVPALYYIAFFLDVSAWIDIYFRAHVGYYNSLNVMVSHPLRTFSHYLRGNFIVDFLACFPFDRIMFRKLYNAEGKAYVTNGVISFFRLFRILQIYKLITTVPNFGVDVLSPPSFYSMLLMMVLLTIIFLNSLTSILMLYCINYLVDKKGNYSMEIERNVKTVIQSLIETYGLSEQPFTMYLVLLYWTTQTSVALGFGDVTAQNNKNLMIYVIIVITLCWPKSKKLFFCFYIILLFVTDVSVRRNKDEDKRIISDVTQKYKGLQKLQPMECSCAYLYLGYVTIVIASFLTSIDMNLTVYQQRMNVLIRFLKAENVEPLLRAHTINHFEYTWEKQKGLQPHAVISNFDTALKQDVFLYLYEEVLRNVGAFAFGEGSTLRNISSCLFEVHFISGAGIYKAGDIISKIYIVHSGEVTLVGKNEEETITLGQSMIFGHFENAPLGLAAMSAVATKNVTILTLTTTELYSIFRSVKEWEYGNNVMGENKLKEMLMKSNEARPTSPKAPTLEYKNTLQYWIYKFSKYIMIFYVLLSYFSINEISYNVSFESESILFLYFLPIDLLFVLKIFLGFNTGYLNEAGDFVSHRRSIARKYLLKGFYIDFFTVIPIELFALALKKKDQIFGVKVLRMVKFLRARNIQAFFNMKIDTLSTNMMFLKITMVFVWTTTLLHQCTCFWFFISCFRGYCPNSKTWKTAMSSGRFRNKYVTSLYFVAVILTTTGFGDVVPYTLLEFCCVDIFCLVGFFFTAIFIGQIISTVQKYLFAKTDFEYAVQALKIYLDVNDVPNETQLCTLRYINNLWRNGNGKEIPDLLKDAPPYLINEIKQTTYGHHINNNPVFGQCNLFFRKQLMNKLRRRVFFPGNVVTSEGEVDRTVFFVHSGLVESRDLDDVFPRKLYGKNTFFGLRQGVMAREPHTMTFTAKTFTIILSLKLEKWEFLVDFFPDDVKYVREHAMEDKYD